MIERGWDRFAKGLYRLGSRVLFRGPEHGDWIYERMRRPRTIATSAMNVLYYWLSIPRIWNPTSVIAEANFGCNLRCSYCWGSGLIDRNRARFMSWEVLRQLMDQLPPSVEAVQWGMLGEPLLHPDLGEMTDYVVSRGRRVLMFTNGTLLKGKGLDTVVNSKFDVVSVSVDVDQQCARLHRGIDLDQIRENVRALVARKPRDMQVKVSVVINENNVDKVDKVWDYWDGLAEDVKFSCMHDLGGNTPPGKCLELWRGNLNVTTEGWVSPCCFDGNEELCIGNVFDQSIEEMAHGERMREILAKLIHGDPPQLCIRCRQYMGFRGPLRTRRGNASGS